MNWADYNPFQVAGLAFVVFGLVLVLRAARLRPDRETGESWVAVGKTIWRWDGFASIAGGVLMLIRGDEYGAYVIVGLTILSYVGAMIVLIFGLGPKRDKGDGENT